MDMTGNKILCSSVISGSFHFQYNQETTPTVLISILSFVPTSIHICLLSSLSDYQLHHQCISCRNQGLSIVMLFKEGNIGLTPTALQSSLCLLQIPMFFSLQPALLGFYYEDAQKSFCSCSQTVAPNYLNQSYLGTYKNSQFLVTLTQPKSNL